MSFRRQMSATWAWNTVTPWNSCSPDGTGHQAGQECRQEGSRVGGRGARAGSTKEVGP